MKVLLDTHALLWWLTADRQISPCVRAVLSDPQTEAYISAVSGFEIASKARLRKLSFGSVSLTGLPTRLTWLGYHALPLSLAHADAAGCYPAAHRDPFDRMLAAQAEIERMPLITIDPAFAAFPIETIW